ncbi:hypothetical protein [Fusobacterium necrophorum]|uniref:hypothetical protein n=1 Tax=Fusobacterium necrophorum TaxID=859 RepID=UPI000788FD83|nr:hypothetical protein [Fusobacterium necrophorum]KYM45711.1 hypothetical protein A2U15_04720 [Fusobacterium necrophorum subsp. funduliforme]MDK4477444.1 hypothetical protein [Fusobacterium necrophorum]
MSYPITVYLVFNPEGMCMSAYTSNFEAENTVADNIATFGYGWKVEPVSLTVTEKFYERLKHIFENQVHEEDVIEADTGEISPKRKSLKHKK